MSDTLKAALAALVRPDPEATSERLADLRDALDIPGAQAALQALEARRYGMLVDATDAAIHKLDVSIRTAMLDVERRKEATKQLATLIEEARQRENEAYVEKLGVDAKEAQQRAFAAYVELDREALRVVELLAQIRDFESYIRGANDEFRRANRGKLLVGQPIAELARHLSIDGQYLPATARWTLHGYTDNTAERPYDVEARPYPAERRLGRFAELLPGWVAPAKPQVATVPAPAPKAATPAAEEPDDQLLHSNQPEIQPEPRLLKNWDGSLSAVPAPPDARPSAKVTVLPPPAPKMSAA